MHGRGWDLESTKQTSSKLFTTNPACKLIYQLKAQSSTTYQLNMENKLEIIKNTLWRSCLTGLRHERNPWYWSNLFFYMERVVWLSIETFCWLLFTKTNSLNYCVKLNIKWTKVSSNQSLCSESKMKTLCSIDGQVTR